MNKASPVVVETIYQIVEAQSVLKVTSAFKSFVAGFGIDAFTTGEIDLDNRKRVVFHCMEWPEEWRKFYLSSGLVDHDPVLSGLMTADGPFTWSDLRADRRLSEAGSSALVKIAAAGWIDGLVVPIARGGHRFGLVSLVARVPITPSMKQCLSAVSVVFHERVKQLSIVNGFTVPPCNLTPREIECARLIALGYSEPAMASQIGISPSTVHEHIERARRKVDAKNRGQLAALCVSLGIITV